MPIDVEVLRPQLQIALGDSLQLGEVLGAGGFAAVFRAHDPYLERDVAIKVLDPALGLTADLEAQFLHEARIIAGTEHPHIVPLYAADSKNGLLYLVMRLLPGQALRGRIAGGKLPPADAGRLALEVARALATAHAKGVIHRDIKPENILLDGSGHAIVTDFGISRVASRPAAEAAGVTVGTPHYLSPEQALGEEVDGRSDVYALGVVLFEMLTGRVPFEGRNVIELIAKHISAPPPKVSDLEPQMPAALAGLVDRMLAKEPAKRPDATELVTLLEAATTPEALMTPGQVRKRRWRRRLVLVGVAVGSAGLVIWLVVRLAVTIIGMFTEGGPDPVLIASGQAVPDSLIELARQEGSLLPGEQVSFAYIPAGSTADDAMLMTDSVLIRRAPTGARRLDMKDGDININRWKPSRSAPTVSLFIVTPKGQPAETLYRNLSGTESIRLLTELGAWNRGSKARAATRDTVGK
jgi:tRNA A-37 threonylcarbamoyl transferase component Bud32